MGGLACFARSPDQCFSSNFATSALMDRLVKSWRVVCELPTQQKEEIFISRLTHLRTGWQVSDFMSRANYLNDAFRNATRYALEDKMQSQCYSNWQQCSSGVIAKSKATLRKGFYRTSSFSWKQLSMPNALFLVSEVMLLSFHPVALVITKIMLISVELFSSVCS